MSRDLLSAIGNRLEARLKPQDARAQISKDIMTAETDTGLRAPFSLLLEAQPFVLDEPGAPSVPPIAPEDVETTRETPATPASYVEPIDIVAKAQAMANATPAALPADVVNSVTASAQQVEREGSRLPGRSSPATAAPVTQTASVASTESAPAASAPQTSPTPVSAAPVAASPVTAPTPRAPTVMPPVPSNFGVGATFRRQGVPYDAPMTVTRIGDGVVFASYTDSEGTREVAFVPDQLDLVTPSP
ncbi:MAG: hypothetical protein IT353_13470 [Gemmatimonadaceae bacterium]|nr:hypothetical protein [Gemmatimonadaceae bacterium]